MKNTNEKITVYPVRQAVWGVDSPITMFFRSKEERDHYVAGHDHLDVLRDRKADPESIEFYYQEGTYEVSPAYEW